MNILLFIIFLQLIYIKAVKDKKSNQIVETYRIRYIRSTYQTFQMSSYYDLLKSDVDLSDVMSICQILCRLAGYYMYVDLSDISDVMATCQTICQLFRCYIHLSGNMATCQMLSCLMKYQVDLCQILCRFDRC